MITDIVEQNQTIAEFCGKGNDIGKWSRAKIKKLHCFEKEASSLTIAQERWEGKGKPFEASFEKVDLFHDDLSTSELRVDHVALFSGLSSYIRDEAALDLMLSNIAHILKPGGCFFGTVPDSAVIWGKTTKFSENQKILIKGDLFQIDFENEQIQFFGTRYAMKLTGEPPSSEYLIHFASFLKIAKKHGLVSLDILNFSDFWEENKKTYQSLATACGVLNKTTTSLLPAQLSLISLFASFVFQKEVL